MEKEKIYRLIKKEDFISEVRKKMAIGMAHTAVALAEIRREKLFLAVSTSWKDYIKQNRNDLGYENSKRLARVGEIYLTFKAQLEENGIKLSENMSKMDLFSPEIASNDPVFYDKFKSLSYRELKKYIHDYKSSRYTYTTYGNENETVTSKGASLYIGSEKIKGINLNEIRKNAEQGKRAVVIWVDDDNEARRIKRMAGVSK